jgi:hypothetical protein
VDDDMGMYVIPGPAATQSQTSGTLKEGGILVIFLGLFLFIAVVLMAAIFLAAVGGHALVEGAKRENLSHAKQ